MFPKEYPKAWMHRALSFFIGEPFMNRGSMSIKFFSGLPLFFCMAMIFFLAGLLLTACQVEVEENNVSQPLSGPYVFQKKCSACHDLERALRATKDKIAWAETIRRMKDQHWVLP